MSEYTTVLVHKETKERLDGMKEYVRESYDEVINKLITIIKLYKEEGTLTSETLTKIERARSERKTSKGMSTKELMTKLGI
jgi:hypothetical protein